MAQPRIAAFARVANGTMAPARVITGSPTKMSRTVHGIAYDPVRDEIYVTNALADAVLVFRGNANGAEPPVRDHTRTMHRIGESARQSVWDP